MDFRDQRKQVLKQLSNKTPDVYGILTNIVTQNNYNGIPVRTSRIRVMIKDLCSENHKNSTS